MLKLLQKFLDSDVIRDTRGKSSKFDEEGSTLYCFVTEPGPLNFVEDMDTSSCHSSPRRPKSPLGKHLRPAPATIVENAEGDSNQEMSGDDTLFMNAYAFLSDSMNECVSVTPHTESVKMKKSDSKSGIGGGERSTTVQLEDSDETASSGSPVKKCRSNTSITSRITLHHHRSAVGHGDSISLNGGESLGASSSHSVVDVSSVVQLSPAQVAGVWKELTLNRLLHLVELETLEGVLAYDAVDGKNIAKNFRPLRITARRSMLATRTSSISGKSRSVRGRRGGGRSHSEVGGATSSSGGVGSTHPSWLNRRFGSRLSRVQPIPSPPPAMNVHTSLYRSRSNNKLHPSSSSSSTTTISPSSSMTSLTLHHKLRYSIKHRSSGCGSSDERTMSTTAAYLPPKSLSSSSPCLAAVGKKEGGRGEYCMCMGCTHQSIACLCDILLNDSVGWSGQIPIRD